MQEDTRKFVVAQYELGRALYYVTRCVRYDEGHSQPAVWFTLTRRVGFGKWEWLGSFAYKWQATNKMKELTNDC